MFNKNFFDTKKDKALEIKESDVIFVADAYMEDYIGGAEITSERFIKEVASSGKKICKIRSNELDVKYFEAGINKYWVFFNYAAMNMNLIPTIVANLRLQVL